MENEVIFSEKQRFTQWWIWVFLAGINLVFIYGIYKQVIIGQPFGDNPMNNVGLILVAILMFSLGVLFWSFQLETVITKSGIYVKYFPFHKAFRECTLAKISKLYVRQYKPLSEFGGWGIKFAVGGQAFNVSGNMGLQIEFMDGKKLLIGTNKPTELAEIINKINEIHTK